MAPDYGVKSLPEHVTFDQIKGTVGSLLLLWSRVEKALTASIRTLHAGEVPKTAHGIGKSLNVWSTRVMRGHGGRQLQKQICKQLVKHLKEALEIRNFVAHGLIGIAASFDRPGEADAHLTAELNGEHRVFTRQELEEMFAWMSRAPELIACLADAAMDHEPESADRSLIPWKNFPVMA